MNVVLPTFGSPYTAIITSDLRKAYKDKRAHREKIILIPIHTLERMGGAERRCYV